jgi:hypothetical protein
LTSDVLYVLFISENALAFGGGGILIDVIWQIKYVKREAKKRNIEEKGGNTKDNREIKS